MSEIDWDKENITTKEWLEVDVNQYSIFHAIQHLGLQRLNVLELDIKHLPKRNVYGLICITEKKVRFMEEKPFIFDDASHLFGPSQVSTQSKENLTQKKRIFQQNIKNADLTINLVNYALLASPSNFGERCGPSLQNYFDPRMETAISEGNDLLASVIPIAFVHNYTAKKFPPKSSMNHVTYFGCYRSTASFDKNDDRILKIDQSGDLIEFEFSDSSLLHFYNSMKPYKVSQIFAIVEDNTKELIEELSEIRTQLIEERSGDENVLETSSFLYNSIPHDDDECGEKEEPVRNDERSFAALASMTAAMENVIESSDYELHIEDQNGEKVADQSFMEDSHGSLEEETRQKRFRRLIKEVSAARREFHKLWFEGMETYKLFLDAEFDTFMESYRMILHNDDKELKRAIDAIEEEAVEELHNETAAEEEQEQSTTKENRTPSRSKYQAAQRMPRPWEEEEEETEEEEASQNRKRRASSSPLPSPKKTSKRGCK